MKTIKLTNYEIASIIEVLDQNPDSIINTKDADKKLPISVLWDIDENMDKLRKIHQKIIQKRTEIEQGYQTDEYSEEVEENGKTIRKVRPQYEQEFLGKIHELFNIVNEIDIVTIMINRLDGYDIIPRDFRQIRFMLDSEKEENNKEGTVE